MSKVTARHLRQTMTDAERRPWSALRERQLGGWKFRRQHPIGPYILDFACLEKNLAIEADGGQHAGSDHDRQRTAWLAQQGWRVIRFWNNDILQNTEGVLIEILRVLKNIPEPKQAPHPSPLPKGEGDLL
ncbi:endonuclease domain-containing protein [Elstera sp.]|jgi:very-short-patch-repair endonuclease|uniref:endonuclease domain-containing protein n=1 Tax=Elstera sp. TaxID=1916664 RepID=UPI0037BE8AB9